MPTFDLAAYGPVFADLLSIDRRRALDQGLPDRSFGRRLDELSIATAFAHARVFDRDMAACCLAGAWLLYDFLDESHAISQGIDTTSGSFWHGVMHRREGDFSNAKYWFRRAGNHGALAVIGQRVATIEAELADASLAPIGARIAPNGALDPCAFVDACQSAHRDRGGAEQFCRVVQQAEWEELFDHCYRRAVN